MSGTIGRNGSGGQGESGSMDRNGHHGSRLNFRRPLGENGTSAANGDEELGLLALLDIVWRRKMLVLLGVASTIALGIIYIAQASPVYRSTAQLLVIKKQSGLSGDSSNTMAEYDAVVAKDLLSTQMVVIRSRRVISNAIHIAKLDSLPSLRSMVPKGSDLLTTISENLEIEKGAKEASDAHAVTISFECEDSRESLKVVNAVIESYREFLGESARNVGNDALTLISSAKDDLRKQLQLKENAYRDFLLQTKLLRTGEKGEMQNMHTMRMVAIEQARVTTETQLVKARTMLTEIETSLAGGIPREAILLALQNGAAGRPTATGVAAESSMRSHLATLQIDEAALLQQLGADHPKLKDMQRQIARERELLTGKLGATALLPDFLEMYIAATRHEVAQSEAQLKSFDLLIANELKAAKALLRDELKEQSMRQDLSRSEKLFDVVVSRLQEINFVKDYGAYNTQVIAPAEEGIQVAPRVILILALCTFLGLCVGSGAAYAAECSDQSFRNSDEIRERLGLQVVGQVPFVSPNAMDLIVPESLVDSYISAFHRPKSHVAEAFRSVRTALYFSTNGELHQLIQVTSASPGDGKSTLACNLAVSIAQSGKRVLLIDADLRRPRIHTLLGIPAEAPGLAALATGKQDMHESVHSTEIGNLWCMPAGGTPDNPAELLTSRRFTDVIEDLRQKYDFVIIDTPPMLVVTDPSIVAARVDGVLLTIRPSKNAQNEAVRAVDALNAVGANVLGVVVNAVASSKSGSFRHGASGSKLYNAENHHYYETSSTRS